MSEHPNPLIQRLRMFAKHRPERLDFVLLELMRDAENAITTEQEMHAAWRKRATESEYARDHAESALAEARKLADYIIEYFRTEPEPRMDADLRLWRTALALKEKP